MQLKWPMLWDFFSLFPAYAGVILKLVYPKEYELALPRIRGGDPLLWRFRAALLGSSPHTRG